MSGFISVQIMASTAAEADAIARALVEEKLAACVNTVRDAHSIYRWEGKVGEADEILLIAKTRADLFGDLCKRVKVLHSYKTPCIVAMPIAASDPHYLEWIAEATAK